MKLLLLLFLSMGVLYHLQKVSFRL